MTTQSRLSWTKLSALFAWAVRPLIVGLAAQIILASCSKTEAKEVSGSFDALPDPPALKALANNYWALLKANCPGFREYAEDLSIDGISDMRDPVFGPKVSGFGISLKIAEIPKAIPKKFGAGGHTCEFRVSPSEEFLITQKTVCAEVCYARGFEDIRENRLTPLRK
ncbi:MAG TPA: hypothetical protein PKY05_00160 [Fibrobacteria bacterium]|nr:hypothetical protein [Fibrobacteria bacterium]